MSIQKNQEYIVDIIDNGFEGEGIAKIDNFTIFFSLCSTDFIGGNQWL